MYNTKILKDSIGPAGIRLTTWELTYPRFVHAELMTHRVFSRNSASSRAIPVKDMLKRVTNDPALPVFWGKNQAGMQAALELEEPELARAKEIWLSLRDQARYGVELLDKLGLHKQIANRVTEPWMFITVVVSSTSFSNWFRLRHHKDAQPEIKWVAEDMLPKYKASEPEELKDGDWHLPLLDDKKELIVEGHSLADLKAISAGRVARVSYLTHEGVRDPKKDIELGLRLATNNPPHMSPLEHVAQAMTQDGWEHHVTTEVYKARARGELFNPMMLGNFVGWLQFRKEFENEHGFDFNHTDLP